MFRKWSESLIHLLCCSESLLRTYDLSEIVESPSRCEINRRTFFNQNCQLTTQHWSNALPRLEWKNGHYVRRTIVDTGCLNHPRYFAVVSAPAILTMKILGEGSRVKQRNTNINDVFHIYNKVKEKTKERRKA